MLVHDRLNLLTGCSCLHVAVQHNQMGVVAYLISKGMVSIELTVVNKKCCEGFNCSVSESRISMNRALYTA